MKYWIIISLIVSLVLGIAGCTPQDAVYVHDSPAVNVSVAGGTINASVPNPLPIVVTNTSGSSRGLNISSDGQLIVNTESVFQEISMHGELEGKLSRSFHVMGRRVGFANTTILQDIKEFDPNIDLFPSLTSLQALEVVSSSANDTAAGSGARTVEVMYLDGTNNLVTSAPITLNGVTPVAAGFTANFIISMEVKTLGASEVAAGNIILRTVVGTITQEQITAGGNRSLSSHFMVPSNYTGYLVSWEASSVSTGGTSQTQDMRIRATVDDEGGLSSAYHFLDNMFVPSGSSPSPQMSLPYIKLPSLTKVKVSTLSSSTSSTTRADASYCLFIVHN